MELKAKLFDEVILSNVDKGIKKGLVHSKFLHAVNLMDESSNIVICLIDKPFKLFGSITISKEDIYLINKLDIKGWYLDKHYLTLDASLKKILIDLNKANHFNTKILPLNKKQIDLKRLYSIKSFISKKTGLFGNDSLNNELFKEKEKRFWEIKEKSFIDHNVKSIIGLGCGLTPSFDDYILGVLLVLYSTKNESLFLSLKRLIYKYQNNTTSVSKFYLLAGCFGHFSGIFFELLKRLNENKSIDELQNKLSDFGHTSGFDTFYGVLTCLIYLGNKEV